MKGERSHSMPWVYVLRLDSASVSTQLSNVHIKLNHRLLLRDTIDILQLLAKVGNLFTFETSFEEMRVCASELKGAVYFDSAKYNTLLLQQPAVTRKQNIKKVAQPKSSVLQNDVRISQLHFERKESEQYNRLSNL